MGTKISEATLRETLKGSESLPIVDTDLPKGRTTIDVLKSYVQPDLSGYATKDEVNEKVSTETYNSDKATFALKSEIPTDYATEEDIQEAISGINIEDLVMYGVEFDTAVSSPDCIRIGNSNLHRTLPVHSQMRGCLLNDDGEVTKYLNESDWTSETRDGSQGQVMVEIPEHYVKFETDGTKRRVKMSITPIVGYKKIGKYYISAYEATVQRSANKLCSVVNSDADYRGGNNNAEWDSTYRSLLGLPATQISRTNFRTYARNRKSGSTEWNCMTYDALSVKIIYPHWEDFINKTLSQGMKVQYDNKLYKVRQDIAAVLENQPPSIDTAALYEEINESHSGTLEDPIPYNNNMELDEGKYYSQDGMTYLCTRSTGQAVYNNLPELVGIYVQTVERESFEL